MLIAFLVDSRRASEREETLVREVTRRLSSNAIIIIIPSRETRRQAFDVTEQLGRRIREWIAGAASYPLWSRLESSTFEVIEATAANRDAIIAGAGCRLAIDLAACAPKDEIANLGVTTYQLYCGETQSTLSFDPLGHAPMRSRHRITWTVSVAGEPPRIAAESSVLITAPNALSNQHLAAGRAIALLLRALEQRSRGLTVGTHWTIPSQLPRTEILAPVRALIVSSFRVWIGRLRRRFMRDGVWFIAYRLRPPAGDSLHQADSYQNWGTNHRAFVADPMVLSHQGIEYLFFEDFRYSLGRGVISWSRLNEDGSLSAPRIALERPYHLSYPFLVEHDGEIYMIPESAANGTIELYRAVVFPIEWELHCTLLHGVTAVDATLHFDGRWWMFVNIGEYGSSTWDELFIFMSERIEGPWSPHPLNPVKCDPSSTRPAGRMFTCDGKLIRPAQDCSTTYGESITLCAVDELTETSFRESVYGRFVPNVVPGVVGVHTLSRTEKLEVIDAMWKNKPRWWRGYPR